MKTTFTQDDKNFVMAFEGRLDTSASSQTEREMQVLNDCEGHNIILDCSQLEYISSSGLRLFLGLLKTAKQKGSQVTIKGLNNGIRQVFDEIGFTRLFNIE
ncbi:MAG: STAS domain-containing protein [Prevotella sp.]|nr:STAS domain-containing protein [Prevotella sp.]